MKKKDVATMQEVSPHLSGADRQTMLNLVDEGVLPPLNQGTGGWRPEVIGAFLNDGVRLRRAIDRVRALRDRQRRTEDRRVDVGYVARKLAEACTDLKHLNALDLIDLSASGYLPPHRKEKAEGAAHFSLGQVDAVFADAARRERVIKAALKAMRLRERAGANDNNERVKRRTPWRQGP